MQTMLKMLSTHQAGYICMAGGIFQVLYGLLAIVFPYGPDQYYGWDEGLWIVANIGMLAGIIGLLKLEAGQPRWLSKGGGFLAISGVILRILASLVIILQIGWDPLALILLSILFVLGGMAALGIGVLRGSQLTGWKAWVPLSVAIFGLIVTIIFSINLFHHFILLGLWEIGWMLLAFVIISNTTLIQARGSIEPEASG
jgi:hypothetical protein